MIQSPSFFALSGAAMKMLLFLAAQYNGRNNGNLSATKSMVEASGVCAASKSKELLAQLEDAGFIVQTRHGIKKQCNLYAVTWLGIDSCPGKHLEIPPGPPRNDWRKTQTQHPSGVQMKSKLQHPSGVHVTPLRGAKAA
ncbi:hypothetical protein QEG26_002789 [Stenotrophomonas maltophilia]|nr:hypothetical protein [Stenotrophomonas maltophilia]